MKALLFASILLCNVSLPASIIINLYENGPDVVMDFSGSMDLSGLANTYNGSVTAGINPNLGVIRSGSTSVSAYNGMTGPGNFGTGVVFITASSSTGDVFGTVPSINEFEVPSGYVSNTFISGSSTWNSASFASLGVTPGLYVWNVGTNTISMSATAPIPEPSTYIALAGFGALGVFIWRRRKLVKVHQPAKAVV